MKLQNSLKNVTKIASVLMLVLITFACNKRTERKLENTTWIGVERTVEFNGVQETTDEFNHILHFRDDGTFYRTYENGTWVIENGKLVVTSYEGYCVRAYKIVKLSNKELILEGRQSPALPFIGCVDGDENDAKIVETYERSK